MRGGMRLHAERPAEEVFDFLADFARFRQVPWINPVAPG